MLDRLRTSSVQADPLVLARHRIHEAGGRGRRAFAMFQAARHAGQILWIVPDHIAERPLLVGLPQGLGERLILLTPKGHRDLLWSAEEALRAGALSLVIAEPQVGLSLTAGRRLQLAAEAGHTTGLMLIHENGGSNATESRWQCEPVARQDSTWHRWLLTKNKRGTLGDWLVDWNGKTPAFHLVPETGERHQSAATPC